jgi:peroxiredoxin
MTLRRVAPLLLLAAALGVASRFLGDAGAGEHAVPAPSVTIGGTVPEFSLKDLEGESFSLSTARSFTADDAWKHVAASAARFGAPDAKADMAIDTMTGVAGEGGKVDADNRKAFLQDAAKFAGLIVGEKTGADLKTLGDVSKWISGAAKAPIVFMVWSSKCPTSRGYEERIVDLFARTGARFYPVASTQVGENDVDSKGYVEAKELPYRVLSDRDDVLCNILGGQRTPHAFLVDDQNRLRYAGSIDNDPIADKEPAERQHWLEDAITAVFQHRDVDVLMTAPKG